MSLLIDDKLIVSMHYKLTDASGEVLDSSVGPQYLPGKSQGGSRVHS